MSRRASSGAWVRSAGAAAVIACCAGCLVPQSVEPKETGEHPAPTIVLDRLPGYMRQRPKLRLVVNQDATNCVCAVTLSVPYIAFDEPSVDLVAKWFIDYDSTKPRSQLGAFFTSRLSGSFADLTLQRKLDDLKLTTTDLGGPGAHVVELVVAEADAFDDSATTYPNRTVKDGYVTAEYRVVVEVVQDPAKPTCDRVVPFDQVCK